MSFSPAQIEEAWSHMRCNSVEVRKSTTCWCAQCGSYFAANRVTEWLNPVGNGKFKTGPVPLTDDSEAFCPNCGMDWVIGDASGLPIQNPDFVHAVTNAQD